MCVGGAPKDNSAAIMAQQEAERKARIEGGTKKIDDTFSQFNDDFYNSRSKAYSDYYMPEIDRQYKAAQDSLTNSLGARGLLTSGQGAKELSDLATQYQRYKDQYTQGSLDYANSLRTNTQSQRAAMISQLEGGGSIDNAANMASTYAANQARPASFSALGNLFQGATAQAANAAMAGSNAFNMNNSQPTFFNATGSKGSTQFIG